jgi:hypothetical protein
MPHIAFAAVTVSLLLTGPIQAKPDFTGKWTETDVPAGRTPVTFTVAQDGNTFSLETSVSNGTFHWLFRLDSPLPAIATVTDKGWILKSGEPISSARWDGDKIVMTSRTNQQTITQVWSMADGKLTIESSLVIGPRTSLGMPFFNSKRTYSR